MATLNELKYAALLALTGETKGTLQELEHIWLTSQGVPEGALNGRWYTLFDRVGVTWNGGAHIWLTSQGVPEGGTLNERFWFLWNAIVNSPPLPSVVIHDPTAINSTGTTALQVVLNWTVAPDGDFPVQSTEIKREGHSDVWVGLPTATYTDTRSIVPDTSIKYRLTTIDTEGNRSVGVEFSVGIPNLVLPSKPAAPTIGAYSTLDKELIVNWTASTAGTFPIVNYKLYRNGVLRATVNALTYTDAIPFDNAFDAYQYRVSAIDNKDNESPQSDLIEVVPVDKATNHLVNPDAPNGSPWDTAGLNVTLLGGGETQIVNLAAGGITRSLVQFVGSTYNEEWYLDGEFRRKTPEDGDFRLAGAEYDNNSWAGASTSKMNGEIAAGEDWSRVSVQRRLGSFTSNRIRYAIQLVNPVVDDMVIECRNLRLFKLVEAAGQINMPDLTLGVGSSGGARHGYSRGQYGSAAPDQLVDGNEIRDLYLNNNNGRLVFKVEGTYPQDEFTTIEVFGFGTLNTADADLFDDSGGETLWRWNNTGWTWTDGDVYAVNFA